MKPIVACVMAAAFSITSAAATAKTVTGTQGRTANEQSVNAVAGPPPASKAAPADDKSSSQPSRKALKKAKVTPPPPMHDPN